MCVMPCEPARTRKSPVDSSASESTSEAPPKSDSQKDLQAAVTADVIEGAPDDRIARAAVVLYRAGKARQSMQLPFSDRRWFPK